MELVIISLVLLACVAICAITGFIHIVQIIFGDSNSNSNSRSSNSARQPMTPEQDAAAAGRLLDYLAANKKISPRNRNVIQKKLASEFPNVFPVSASAVITANDVMAGAELKRPPRSIVAPTAPPIQIPSSPDTHRNANPSPRTFQEIAELAAGDGPHAQQRPKSSAKDPFDIPDESPPAPKRSLNEVLAGFMEKKNIRWGELASGILILGSVVGLVVSLKDELRDKIPYFSALIFMVVTAAIHGSGIYTLRKWNLRTTSRGVLLIGLLLVPLNFLAACVLNGAPADRRAITDPLYWVAIVIGIAAYGAMSFYSSRELFRRRFLPIAITVVAAGASILVANRFDQFHLSIVLTIGLTTPAVLAYLFSFNQVGPQQWTKQYVSHRFRDRALSVNGLGLFSIICLLAFLLIRSATTQQTLFALAPVLSVLAVSFICQGDLFYRQFANRSTKPNTHANRSTLLIGRSINVFGWGALIIAAVLSMTHPTVALINAAATCAVIVYQLWKRRVFGLINGVWCALSAAAVVGLAAVSGSLEMDGWPEMSELATAFSHSTTGVALIGVGLLAGMAQHFGLNKLLTRLPQSINVIGGASATNPSLQYDAKESRLTKIVAATLLLLGLGIVLLASLIHRNQPWDCGLASGLLGMLALGALALAVVRSRHQAFAPIAIIFTLAFFAHGLFWNQIWGQWLQERITGSLFDPRLLISATAATGLFASAGFIQTFRRYRRGANDASLQVAEQPSGLGKTSASSFQWAAFATAFIAIVVCFFVAVAQSGVGLVCLGILAVALLAVTWRGDNRGLTESLPLWLLLCLSACIASIVVKSGLTETLANGTHFVLQVSVAGIFLALVAALKTFLPHKVLSPWLPLTATQNSSSNRNLRTLGYEVPLLVGMVGLFVLLMGLTTVDLAGTELSANWKTLHPDSFSPAGQGSKLSIAAGILLASSVVVYLLRPSVAVLSAIVAAGVVSVGVFAANFHEAKSVGTALRWLVPIGSAVVALVIGIRRPFAAPFAKVRQQLRLSGRSSLPALKTQAVINRLLVVAVCVVLGISTVTVCQLLLHGKEVLGGPVSGSFFGDLRKDVSFGGPVGILVATFLWYAITERRSVLAMCGSAVFQYVVLMAVTLLFISPHPKLASDWFVNIMQAISLGMTGYGIVWWWYRKRIGETKWNLFGRGIEFLNAHTAINGVLIGSLVVLILQRYWVHPAAGGGWITSVGGWLGIVAAISMFGFAWTVWKQKASKFLCWYTLAGGMTTSAFVAAAVDKFQTQQMGVPIPWSSFRVILAGTLLTVAALLIQTVFAFKPTAPRFSIRKLVPASQSRGVRVAIGLSIAISFLYCLRGAYADPEGYWIYLIGSALLLFSTACYTYYFRSGFSGIPALVLMFAFVNQVMDHPWIDGSEPHRVCAAITGCGLWALMWFGLDRLSLKFNRPMPRGFFVLLNLVVFLSALTICGFCGLCASFKATQSEIIGNVYLILAVVTVGAAWICNLFNRGGRALVSSGFLWAIACSFFVLTQIPSFYQLSRELRVACLTLCLALPTFFAALSWFNVDQLMRLGPKIGTSRTARTKQAMRVGIPIWIYCLGAIVLTAAFLATGWFELREARMLMSLCGLGIAIALIVLSFKEPRYHVQVAAIGTFIASLVLIGWSNIGPDILRSQPLNTVLVALVVPAASVFIIGMFATRWIRPHDSWIAPIRDATAALTVITLLGFGLLLVMQFQFFDHEVGSGLSVVNSVSVTLTALGMIVALVIIAVLPHRDPLSMSLTGRQAYVYIGQVVLIMTAAHVYLSMPWLLKTGILKFWPYLAMFVSFAGIVMSEVLKKRNLEVLSQPLFNTAGLIPVLVSIGFWLVDSRADAALTFLLSGMIYLGISMLTRSVLAGILALVMGNIALWIFYGDMSISFSNHPQLWLIPPAISVLVASHLERKRFSAGQLAFIRYACVFVIYLSSTSEIFVRGIGNALWPPMVLAVLSVAGMAAGILMQVRAFLFVGAAFLLTSMIAMVSLAQNRFEHVWPWWAFGICMGAAILVGFGVFEKRRNDLVRIGKGMREWDF